MESPCLRNRRQSPHVSCAAIGDIDLDEQVEAIAPRAEVALVLQFVIGFRVNVVVCEPTVG